MSESTVERLSARSILVRSAVTTGVVAALVLAWWLVVPDGAHASEPDPCSLLTDQHAATVVPGAKGFPAAKDSCEWEATGADASTDAPSVTISARTLPKGLWDSAPTVAHEQLERDRDSAQGDDDAETLDGIADEAFVQTVIGSQVVAIRHSNLIVYVTYFSGGIDDAVEQSRPPAIEVSKVVGGNLESS